MNHGRPWDIIKNPRSPRWKEQQSSIVLSLFRSNFVPSANYSSALNRGDAREKARYAGLEKKKKERTATGRRAILEKRFRENRDRVPL